MTTPSSASTRALVLSGGGIAGIAWESGLLTGLLEGGIDLTAADLAVGTSAGSVVSVTLRAGHSGDEIAALLAAQAQRDTPDPDAPAPDARPEDRPRPPPPPTAHSTRSSS